MKTMAFAQVQEVLLTVHTKKEPSDADWDAYLAHLERTEAKCGIVWTPGGAPNSKQRKRLLDVLGRRTQIPTVVLSNSRIVRGIVTALSWFGQKVWGFPLDGFDAALKALNRESQRDSIHAELVALKSGLGLVGEIVSVDEAAR